MITPVNLFLVLTSVIVHGITIPIGKGFHTVHTVRTRTRTIPATSNGFSSSETNRFNIRALLPFTHIGGASQPDEGARQPDVANGSDSIQVSGMALEGSNNQADYGHGSLAAALEHGVKPDFRATTTTGTI